MKTLVCPQCYGVVSEPTPGHCRCRWCRWVGTTAEAAEPIVEAAQGSPVTEVRFVAGRQNDIGRGLLGYIAFRYGGVRLDGVVLRRTSEGRLTLSFPERRDSSGRGHPYVRPIDEATRRDLERQILAALGIDEEAAR